MAKDDKKDKSKKEKQKDIEDAVNEIKQKFGEGSIMKLKEVGAVDVDAIPTGSLALDIALGVLGVPRGRIIEVYGPEASGKSTLALHVTAEAQKKGGVAAFVDAEHALDPDYARKIGVNIEDLLISQPDSGEQALEIVESLVRSSSIDIIVVDSVAALTPKEEIAGEMGDKHVGLQARLMSQACLVGETELIDPVTGEISTIGEIVNNRLPWHTSTYNEQEGKFVTSKITDWIPQGKKECYKVETSDGRTLKLTDDHLVFTFEGWKEVKDLTEKDHLAIPRKATVPESGSSELSEEAVKIIGYILGDGNFTNSNYALNFSNVDPKIIKDLNSALEEFDCELRQRSYKDYQIVKNNSLPKGSYRSPIKEALKKVGLYGKKAPDKEIPSEIFKLSKEKLSLFISRLWACDGHIDSSARSVVYSSSSLKLIKQLHHLLLKFGIVARYSQERPSPHPLYKLIIQGESNIKIFEEEIGIVGEKSEKLKDLVGTERKSRVVPFENTMPYKMVPAVKEAVYDSGHTGMEISHLSGKTNRTSFPEWKAGRLRLSREHLEEVADFIEDEELQEIAEEEVYWSKIDSISSIGKREVYDISVEDYPNFVANGVLVHNCRKLSSIVSKTKTAVIFLNQTRMKIGVPYGNPTTTPGGKALKFYSSVRISLRRKAKIKEGDEITGSRIKAKVVKNKVAAPFRTAQFDIFYNEGISKAGDLLNTAVDRDIVDRSGSWYKYEGKKLGQGKSNAREFLQENPEVMEEIEEKIVESHEESRKEKKEEKEKDEEDEEKD